MEFLWEDHSNTSRRVDKEFIIIYPGEWYLSPNSSSPELKLYFHFYIFCSREAGQNKWGFTEANVTVSSFDQHKEVGMGLQRENSKLRTCQLYSSYL